MSTTNFLTTVKYLTARNTELMQVLQYMQDCGSTGLQVVHNGHYDTDACESVDCREYITVIVREYGVPTKSGKRIAEEVQEVLDGMPSMKYFTAVRDVNCITLAYRDVDNLDELS